jgi:hypothetical protein
LTPSMALVFVFPLTWWPGDHKCLEIDVAPGRTAARWIWQINTPRSVLEQMLLMSPIARTTVSLFTYLYSSTLDLEHHGGFFPFFFFFFFFFVAASWGCGSCAISESVFPRCIYSLYLVLYVTYAVARPFLDCASRSRIGRQLPLAPSPRGFGERSLECGAILGGGDKLRRFFTSYAKQEGSLRRQGRTSKRRLDWNKGGKGRKR